MRMKRNNVERVAESKEEAEKLKMRGFKEVSVKTERVDFGKMKISALRTLAKQKGVEGYEKMKKEELLEILEIGGNEDVGAEEREEDEEYL